MASTTLAGAAAAAARESEGFATPRPAASRHAVTSSALALTALVTAGLVTAALGPGGGCDAYRRTALAARGGSTYAAFLDDAGVFLPDAVHAIARRRDLPRGWRGRTVVVGDVHGCLPELRALLKKADFDPHTDALVSVGDLGTKGAHSAETVKFMRGVGALAVRGNHDDAALAAAEAVAAGRRPPPAQAWVANLSAADVAWLDDLPFSLALPAHGALAVHAGVVPGVGVRHQFLPDLYTMRDLLPRGPLGRPWRAVEVRKKGSVPWAPVYEGGGGHVLFGHDAGRGLQREAHATGLDTGCVYGGRLTAVVLEAEVEEGGGGGGGGVLGRPGRALAGPGGDMAGEARASYRGGTFVQVDCATLGSAASG